jgi:hypothetical protein
MFIIRWKDQTCFGPFQTSEEAISWTEKKFRSSWSNLRESFYCHYVEPVTSPTS